MKKFTLLLSAILLACVTNLWAGTYTLTAASGFQSSYNDAEKTLTDIKDNAGENPVTFGYTGCMYNAKNTPAGWGKQQIIQARKYTTAKPTEVYNTTAINGLQTVTIKMQSTNQFTIYYGDTKKPSTNSIASSAVTATTESITYTDNNGSTGKTATINVYTFDLSGKNATYFLFANGSFVNYVYEISCTYEAAPVEPTLTAEPKEINLSAAYDAETGTEGETTVKISGKNLVEGGKINLSLNYDESSDCTWDFVAPESKEIEVTNATVEQDVTISYYAINAGTYTATLTITATDATSADIATVSIPVSLNVVAPYTISWSVNGTITKSTLLPGATLKDIMPATAEVPSACSDKAFVGWCTTSTVAENGEGIVYVNENTIPEGDATYYAVFAKGSQVEGEKTIEFVPADYVEANNITIANDNGYDCSTMTVDEITITADGGSTNPRFWEATNGTIDYRIYNGCTMTISTSVGELTNITVNKGTTYQFTIAEDKKTATYSTNATVKITSISATIKTMVGGYSEYATTCKGTGTEIENVVAPAAIRKMIENGQLVIIIDGVKYNAQGVVIR